jgi:hypothetical protein
MIVYDLNGVQSIWKLSGLYNHTKAGNKSSLHIAARSLLKEIFPTCVVLEEIPIYVRKSEILYLDFFMPLTKLCIEVHGEQHYSFVKHYHHNMMGFIKSKKRDNDKREWCDINNIQCIELPYNKIDEWRNIIHHEYQRTS